MIFISKLWSNYTLLENKFKFTTEDIFSVLVSIVLLKVLRGFQLSCFMLPERKAEWVYATFCAKLRKHSRFSSEIWLKWDYIKSQHKNIF